MKNIQKIFSRNIYENKTFLKLAEIKPLVWLFTFGQQPRFKNLTIQEIKNFRPKRIAQLGCVPGSLSKEIAEAISRKGKLWIFDVSKNALKLTRNKIKEFKNIELVEANAENTNFPGGAFDIIVVFFLLHEVPTKKAKIKILHEASRLLVSGGLLLIVDYHKTSNGWIKSMIEKIIRTIEPFSGELMDFNLPETLEQFGFRIKKIILGRFALYQFVVAKKL